MTFRDELRTAAAARCREPREESTAARLVGTLRRVTEGRPFAFIRCDTGEEFFADRREVRDPALWKDGARVSFIPSVANAPRAVGSTRHDHRPPAWQIGAAVLADPPAGSAPQPASTSQQASGPKNRACRTRKLTPSPSSLESEHVD